MSVYLDGIRLAQPERKESHFYSMYTAVQII